MPLSNRPLPEQMSTNIYDAIWRHQVALSKTSLMGYCTELTAVRDFSCLANRLFINDVSGNPSIAPVQSYPIVFSNTTITFLLLITGVASLIVRTMTMVCSNIFVKSWSQIFCHVSKFTRSIVMIHQIIPCTLTHWGRVTHIYAIKLTIVVSDNGLLPGRRRAFI